MLCRFRLSIWCNVSCKPLAVCLFNVVLILGILVSPLRSLDAPACGVATLPATTSTDSLLSLPMQRTPSSPMIDVGEEGAWDSEVVRVNAVIKDESTYRMWYIMWYTGMGAVGFGGPARIGYATSSNGVSWTRHAGNPVLWPGQWWVYLPAVVKN